MVCGSVTSRKGQHPWPTDGITKGQLDKQTDRLDRRIDLVKEKHENLSDRIKMAEAAIREILLLRR